MRLDDPRYSRWALCREMLEAPAIVRRIAEVARPFAHAVAEAVRRKRALLVVGEGSSLLFPGRRAAAGVLARRWPVRALAAGCAEAAALPLGDFAVLAFSKSGKTAEVVALLERLARDRHDATFAVTSVASSPVAAACARSFVLPFAKEEAFAATTSVVAQALFVDEVLEDLIPADPPDRLDRLAGDMAASLASPLDAASVKRLAAARVVYFTGEPQVVGELALKCNEIARKPAVALEGALVDHGPRRAVISPADAVVPVAGDPYVALAAGWNLLVEVGLALGTDLDGRDLHV
jgi:glucosamine--fructose-6-phosphate aminotransferase (isomerizing)